MGPVVPKKRIRGHPVLIRVNPWLSSRTVQIAMLVAAALCPLISRAQGSSRAAVFLTLPASARGLALGDAWGAAADDESALFYNPAGLARITHAAAGGSVQRHVASTTLGAGAIAVPAWRGTFALGATMIDYGSVNEVVSDVQTGRRVSAQDVAIEAGYAATAGAARFGAAIEFVRQSVAELSGSAIAASVGAGYTIAGWDVAGALQHAGSRVTLGATSASLPLTWRASTAAPSFALGGANVRTMAEVRQVADATVEPAIAAEARLRAGPGGALLALRASYALHDASNDRTPCTAGGGVTLGAFSIDYAWSSYRSIGEATHRIGFRWAAR